MPATPLCLAALLLLPAARPGSPQGLAQFPMGLAPDPLGAIGDAGFIPQAPPPPLPGGQLPCPASDPTADQASVGFRSDRTEKAPAPRR